MFYFVNGEQENDENTFSYFKQEQNILKRICIVSPTSRLFKIAGINDDFLPDFLSPVPETLRGLLYSCEKYEPSLVLSLNEIKKTHKNHEFEEILSKEKFLDIFPNLLKRFLQAQMTSKYILAEAQPIKIGDMGWLSDESNENHFYWILDYEQESERVKYISDFQSIEIKPATWFKINKEILIERFSK